MAVTWSIEPQVQGVTISSDGTLTYTANTTETSFTVKYDDGQGCSGEYVYRIPEGCGNTPPPAPDPPEPPGPEPPGPGPEPSDTCDDLEWTDVGYSWCVESTSPGTYATASCSKTMPEVTWGTITETGSANIFKSFSTPELSDGKWVLRGEVKGMPCDCSTRSTTVSINYTVKGVSKSYTSTVIQRGWPVGAEHCP